MFKFSRHGVLGLRVVEAVEAVRNLELEHVHSTVIHGIIQAVISEKLAVAINRVVQVKSLIIFSFWVTQKTFLFRRSSCVWLYKSNHFMGNCVLQEILLEMDFYSSQK